MRSDACPLEITYVPVKTSLVFKLTAEDKAWYVGNTVHLDPEDYKQY